MSTLTKAKIGGIAPSEIKAENLTQVRLPSKSLDKPNGKRKSAFSPYKSTATVLTNLQRGNTEASVQSEISLSFHERAGQGEITEHQIRQLPNVDALDGNDLSALHWASYYGQLTTARLLIKYGANVSQLGPDFVSPLLLAAAQGHHEIVRLLMQHGADPNQTDVVGNTALMFATAGNHPHTCNELLAYKPDLFQCNEFDDSAYSLAVQNGATLAQAVLENYIVGSLTSHQASF